MLATRNPSVTPLSYEVLKFIHVVGVIVLLGNVTITAFWKVLSDMSGDIKLSAHAQRATIIADWLFTLPSILLILIGGYGMAYVGGMDLLGTPWLVLSQVLFVIPGIIWLAVLVPLQIRQSRSVQRTLKSGDADPNYGRDSRIWLIWGIIATVPLVAAIYVMIAKPG